MSRRTNGFRDTVTSAIMSDYNKQIRENSNGGPKPQIMDKSEVRSIANKILPKNVSAKKRESLTRQFN